MTGTDLPDIGVTVKHVPQKLMTEKQCYRIGAGVGGGENGHGPFLQYMDSEGDAVTSQRPFTGPKGHRQSG